MSNPMFIGQLFKTLRVDHEDQTVHFQTRGGQIGRVSNLNGTDKIEPGDLLIVGQNGWEIAPSDLWHDSGQIGAVRRVMDDGSIIVDSGVGS